MGVFNTIKDFICRRKNPIKYWRKRGAIIGDNCEIYGSSCLGSEPYLIKIGDFVRISAGAKLTTHDGGVWVIRKLGIAPQADILKGITIGNNVHIGVNAIIMPGVTIGNNCIIGCAAVVTKDIPDNSVAVGVPARVIKTIYEYHEKNRQYYSDTNHLTSKEKQEWCKNKGYK